jgi:hypothetical protein
MESPSEFQGSFSGGVEREHDGHLKLGSFGNFDCPDCRDAIGSHLAHEFEGSFSEGMARDAEGHLPMGSFGGECVICTRIAKAPAEGS